MNKLLFLKINTSPVNGCHGYSPRGKKGKLYTHQTENVCADPPSKPAPQDMLTCFTPGEMDREVAAWGLVPVMEGKERSWWNSASTSSASYC